MSKVGFGIEGNIRRPVARDSNLRSVVRRSIHPPEKRATTRTLFLIGALTLVLIGGGAVGLLY